MKTVQKPMKEISLCYPSVFCLEVEKTVVKTQLMEFKAKLRIGETKKKKKTYEFRGLGQ